MAHSFRSRSTPRVPRLVQWLLDRCQGSPSRPADRLRLEPLEPRLLLSADPLNFAALDQGLDLTLRLSGDALEVIDHRQGDTATVHQLDGALLTLTGSSRSDTIRLELTGDLESTDLATLSGLTAGTGPLTFNLGQGDDRLTLNGFNATAATDLVITGDGGDDSVVVEQDLATAGGSLTIDAETITVQGVTLSTLDGANPAGDITLEGQTITLADGSRLLARGAGPGGDITLSARNQAVSSASLGFKIDDIFDVAERTATLLLGDVDLQGADITLEARAGDRAAGPLTFQARGDIVGNTIQAGPDHGLATGTPVVYRTDGSAPVAGLEEGKIYYVIDNPLQPQRISLAATQAEALVGLAITLDPAPVEGEHVLEPQGQPDDAFIPAVLSRLISDFLSLPAALGIKGAEATLDIQAGASIQASGDVTVASLAEADGSVQSISGGLSGLLPVARVFSVAYSEANASAATTIAGEITAGGSVTVTSQATATADALARTSRNLGTTAPTDKDAFAFALALAFSDTTAHTTLVDTARLTAGGNVDIRADGTSTNKASAETGTYEDGLAGIALGLGFADGEITTTVDGEVTAAAQGVSEDQDFTGIRLASALSAEELAGGVSQTRGDPLIKDALLKGEVTPVLPAILNASTGKSRDAAGRSNSLNDTDISVAGTLAYTQTDLDALATLGADGRLASGQDVAVTATLRDRVQTVAESTVSQRNDKFKDDAFAVAVIVGQYDDTARARVDGTIDAAGTVTVEATITYPFLTDPAALYTSEDFASPTAVGTLLDQKLGLQSKLFNSWARSVGDGSEIGLAGSVNYMDFANLAEAIVGGTARINQGIDAAYRSDQQNVTVKADIMMELVDMAGVFDLNFQFSNLAELRAKSDPLATLNPMGAEGSKGALGAGVLLLRLDNTSQALVEDAAKIIIGSAGLLQVSAGANINNIMLTQAGAKGGRLGFAGTFGRLEHTSLTRAHIGNGAEIRGGEVAVTALDRTNHVNLVGGVIKAQATGVGVSVGINLVERTSEAGIGSSTDQAPGAGGLLDLTGDLTLSATNTGQLNAYVLAAALVSDRPGKTEEVKPLEGNAPPAPAEQRPQYRTGIGIAGAVGYNTVTETTEAFLNTTADVTADQVTITARDDTDLVAATGGAALNRGGPSAQTSTSLAGAFSWNRLTLTTRALLAGVDLTSRGEVTVEALREGDLFAFSAGGAGTTSPAQRNTAVAGSVSINRIVNVTEALLDGVDLAATAGSDVTVTATDRSGILAVGGGVSSVSGSGKGSGVGAGIGFTEIDTTTRAAILAEAGATTLGSADQAIGDLTVQAENDNLLRAIGISLGNAPDLAAAGTLGINLIGNRVEGAIDGATIHSGGAVTVTALDDSSIQSVSGALGLSRQQLGFGAAIAWNQIDNTLLARVDDATLRAGSVAVAARSTETDDLLDGKILSATIGAASGKETALAGSVSINIVNSDVEARIGAGSDLTVAGHVTVQGEDQATIRSLAGGLAFSPGANAFGAAVAVDVIVNRVAATVEDATVVAGGNVTIAALEAAAIDSLAMGLAGGGNFALGGSVAVSDINTDTQARVMGSSLIDAEGSVAVTAEDGAAIFAIAGAVGAAKSSAVGISSSTAVTINTTRATVGGESRIRSRANGSGLQVASGEFDGEGNPVTEPVSGLAVIATSRQDITNVAVAGSGAGSTAVAGSVPVTVISQTTGAVIEDGALINDYGDVPGSSNADLADTDQRVTVLAVDDTRVLSVAGGVAGSGSTGVGVGVDVGVITKTTEAILAADRVNAREHVLVQSLSREDVTSISASLGGGGANGVGGSVSSYTLVNETRALVADGTVIDADGSVVVSADDAAEVDMIAGNAAIGGQAGVGASVGVTVIDKTTDARIGAAAQVTARGLRGGLTVNTGSLRLGAPVAETPSTTPPTLEVDDQGRPVNRDELEVRAPGRQLQSGARLHPETDEDASDPLLSARRVVAPETVTFSGVAVTATSRDDVESFALSLGGSGNVAVNVGGGVTVIDNDTRAVVEGGATVTADNGAQAGNPGLLIGAGSDSYHLGVAGVAGLSGNVAVTPGVDVVTLTTTTEAYADDGARLQAEGHIDIQAQARQEVLTVAAGFAGSGNVGVGGAVAVIVVDSTTRASLGGNGAGAQADAGGNVRIQARDDSEVFVIAGSLGAGLGAAGAGGSVAVVTLAKDTRAFVGDNSRVDAGANLPETLEIAGELTEDGTVTRNDGFQGLTVEAQSSEDIFNLAAAAAGGSYAGLAGGVTVEVLDSDTRATIGRNARINQGGGSAGQGVNVSAVNRVDLFSFAGGLAISGGAGIGGGVDVGILRNDTVALIDQGAEVAARDGVTVTALAPRDITTVAVSASGSGASGFAGSVSVWAIGTVLDASTSTYEVEQRNAQGESLSPERENALDRSKLDSTAGAADGQDQEFTSILDAYSREVGFTRDEVDTDSDTLDLGSHPFSDGEQVVYRVAEGGQAIGGLEDGGRYFVVVGDDGLQLAASRADAGAGRIIDLEAGGSATGHSLDTVLGDSSGSQSDRVEDNSTAGNTNRQTGQSDPDLLTSGTTALIARGATVEAGGSVEFTAGTDLDLLSLTGSATIGGGIAAGASVGIVTVQGQTLAAMDGTVSAADRINIDAGLDQDLHGIAVAGGAGGSLALGAQVVVLTDHAGQQARLGDGAVVTQAGGGVNIRAEADRNARADAVGGGLSLGGAVGASVAVVTVDGATQAVVGDADVGQGAGVVDSLTVAAVSRLDLETDAKAVAGGVAVAGVPVSLTGSVAIGRFDGTVEAAIVAGARVDVNGDIQIGVDSRSLVEADALGVTASILGASLGGSVAIADNQPLVRAILGDADLQAGGLIHIGATHNLDDGGNRLTDATDANATSVSGGLLAGAAGAVAIADGSALVEATVTAGAALEGGEIALTAGSGNEVDATATGVGGGIVGAGASIALVTLDGHTKATTGAVTLAADGAVTVTARADNDADAYVLGVTGGIGSGSGNVARATVGHAIEGAIGDGATVMAGAALAVQALSRGQGRADSDGVNVAGLAIGVSVANARLDSRVDAALGADFVRAGSITVQGLHNFDGANSLDQGATATGSASGGGILSGNGADVDAIAAARASAELAGADIVSDGAVQVIARSHNDADARGNGLTIGGVGIGVILADARGGGGAEAGIGTDSGLQAASLDLEARGSTFALADTDASGGGALGGNGSVATATITPTVKAEIGAGADVGADGDLNLTARSEGRAYAQAEGITGGAVAVGASLATARETVNVDLTLGNDAQAGAGGEIRLAAGHNVNLDTGQLLSGNTTRARATSSSGSLIGGVGSDAQADSTVNVDLVTGSNSRLIGAGNVELVSRSGAITDADASGFTGGVAAAGITAADAHSDGGNRITTGSGSRIDAAGDLSLSANTVKRAYADTVGGVGGVIGGASTRATARVDDTTRITIGQDSQALAPQGTLTLEALSAYVVHGKATITTGGVVTFNATTADSDLVSETEVVIGQDARLLGDTTRLAARVLGLDADAEAFSKTFAADSTSQASALLDVDADTLVSLAIGADVTGVGLLELVSRQDGVDTDSDAAARIGAGVTGVVRATSRNNLDLDSDILTQGGSALRSEDLRISAQAPRNGSLYHRDADAEAGTIVQTVVETVRVVENVTKNIPIIGWIVEQVVKFVTVVSQVILHSDESETLQGGFASDNSVILNGDLYLGSAAGVTLTVAEDDTLTTSGEISGRIDAGRVVVDDIVSTLTGRLTVSSPSGLLAGQGTIHKGNVLDRVEIVNRTARELVINGIQPVNPDVADPQLVYTSDRNLSNFAIVGIDGATPTVLIDSVGDVTFAGEVANSGGELRVSSEGDIHTRAGAAVQANRIILSADGNLGSQDQRLDLELFRDVDNARLEAATAGDAWLSVTLGEIGQQITSPLDGAELNVMAGGRVDLLAEPARVLTLAPDGTLLAIPVNGVYRLGDISGSVVKIEVIGDALLTGAIESTAGTTEITVSGSLTGAGGSIDGDRANLQTGGNLGTAGAMVAGTVANLSAQAGGSIHFAHQGDGNLVGLEAGQTVIVTSLGGLTVGGTVTGRSVTLTALDAATTGNNLIVNGQINALAGAATLEAGDRLTVADTGRVVASGAVLLQVENGGAGNADSGGATLAVLGMVQGTAVTLRGGQQGDQFTLGRVEAGGLTVAGEAGDDTIEITRLPAIVGAVTVRGGADQDRLVIDATAATAGLTGTVTGTTVTGLGLVQGVDYQSVEELDIDLGTGADRLTVRSTTAATTVRGGAGADRVTVTGTDGQLTGISGQLTFLGQGEDDRLEVSATGATAGLTGTLDGTALTGLGMGAGIDFETVEELDLALGQGGDDFTVAATTVTSRIVVGGGDDVVTVGQALEAIRGALTLAGGGQTGDRLTFDDTASTDASPGTLDGDRLEGFGMGAAIDYQGFARLTLAFGEGVDDLTVRDTATVTMIDTGGESDRVTVDGLGHTTTLNTAAGADQVTVTGTGALLEINLGDDDDILTLAAAGAGINVSGGDQGTQDRLVIDRTGRTTPDQGQLAGGQLAGFNPGGIAFTAIEQLDVRFGDNSDRFTLQSTPEGLQINLTGNGGDDEVLVQNLAGFAEFIGGQGTDALTLEIDDDPAARSEFADGLTVAAELLIVDNRGYGGDVEWTADRDRLLADGNRLVSTGLVDELRILGGNGDNGLTVQETGNLDVTATLDGNRVDLEAGRVVLEPRGFATFDYYQRVMDFQGLANITGSYTESGLRLTSSGALLRVDGASAAAAGQTGTDQLILTLDGSGPFEMRSLSLRSTTGGETVSFTGSRSDGSTVTTAFLIGEQPTRLTFPGNFTDLTALSWTAGTTVVDDIVASPLILETTVIEPGTAGGTLTFDALAAPASQYQEDGITLTALSGQLFRSDFIGPAVFPSISPAQWRMTATDGSPFDLRSLQVRELNSTVAAQTLVFTGNRADGSTVSRTFVTNGPGPVAYQSVNFGDDFSNLLSVTWNPGLATYDNLVVESPDYRMAFDGLDTNDTVYREDGAQLSVSFGAFNVATLSSGGFFPDVPAAFPENVGQVFTFEMEDGGLFQLRSLDVQELNGTVASQTLTFTGTRYDGSTVTQSYTTGGPGSLTETITFGAYFTDLVSVSWRPNITVTDNIEFRPIRVTGISPLDPQAEAQLQGLDQLAVSPDGGQIYAVNGEQNALVVINAQDLTQRQLLVDGQDGVSGLRGADQVLVSPDGRHVYVSGSQGRTVAVFARDASDGSLTFVESLQLPGGDPGTTLALALSPDGSTLRVEAADFVDEGVRIVGDGLTTEFFVTGGTIRDFPDFDNLTPVVTQTDSQVYVADTTANLRWHPNVQPDDFAVRYSGRIEVAGTDASDGSPMAVTFRLGSDDGSRLFIDDVLVLDNGGLHDYRTLEATVNLTAGLHDIRVEYFEATQAGSIRLDWRMGGSGNQLLTTADPVETRGAVLTFQRNATTGGLSQGAAPIYTNGKGITALADAGQRFYALGDDGTLAVFDGGNAGLLQTLTVPDQPADLTVSDDGRFVYLVGGNTLTVLEWDGSRLDTLQTISSGGNTIRGIQGASGVALSGDGRFLYVTGAEGNGMAAFQRDGDDGTLAFQQLFINDSNGSLGLESPAAVATSSDGTVYVASSQGPGGLAAFALAGEQPQPDLFTVTFQDMARLTLETGDGNDFVDLIDPASRDGDTAGMVTTLDTGDGADQVNLGALGGTTVVTTGDGRDTVEVRADQGDTTLTVDLGEGDDTARLRRSGAGSLVTLNGGIGADRFTVESANLDPSSTLASPRLVIEGGGPTAGPGDRLEFVAVGDGVNPQESLNPLADDVTPPGGLLGALDESGDPLGIVSYSALEEVEVLAAPDAEIDGPFTLAEGASLVLSAAGSRDFGRPVRYQWDIDGDGFFGEVQGQSPTVTWQQLVAFGLDDDGTYTIGLRVTNDLGLSNDAFAQVTLTNTPPQPVIGGPAQVDEGSLYTLDLGLAQPDPGADTLQQWRVDWGDGTVETFPGDADIVRHVYQDDGSYTIISTVTDEDTSTATSTTVTVANVAPTLELTGADTVTEGQDWRLQLSAQDPGDDTVAQWQVDWGDGSVETFAGAVQDLTHGYADDGQYSVTVTATDEDGQTTASRTVQVTNAAPQLTVTGPERVAEGSPLTLELSAQDAGNDTVTGWRVDWGDGIEKALVGSATNASHSYADDGSFTVTVTATDEDGSYTTTRTITVDNVAPTLTLAGATTVAEGSPYTLDLSATDPGSDTVGQWRVDWGDGTVQTVAGSSPTVGHRYADDGDYTIAVSARDEDGLFTAQRSVTVTDVAPQPAIDGPAQVNEGQGYTLTLSATDPGSDTVAGWTVDWGDGTVEELAGTVGEATHVYGDDGSYTITATVRDEAGVEGSTDTTVQVLDLAPQLVISQPGPVDEGDGFTLALSAVDAGDDTVETWIIDWGDGTSDTVPGRREDVEQTGADGNTVIVQRDTATVQHAYGDDGVYDITVTAINEDGSYTTGTQVTVDNVAPNLTITGPAEVAEGSPYKVNLGEVQDPGDDTLTGGLTVDWGDGSVETFAQVPDTLSHVYADDGLYQLAFTLEDEDGVHPQGGITFQVADDESTPDVDESQVQSTALQVRDIAPTLEVTGAAQVAEGSPYTLNLSATDPGNDAIESWTVDWGDDTVETFQGPVQSVSHVYGNDGPRRITVQAREGGDVYLAGKDVAVVNVAPTVGTPVPDALSVVEGQTVTVGGTFSDPALGVPGENFTGTAIWSDAVTSLLVIDPAGSYQTSRTFGDDLPGQGSVTVTVTLADGDGGEDAATSPPIEILNAPPVIGGFSLTETAIDEGGTVIVRGTFTDAALGQPGETFTGTAIWSDGVETALVIDATGGTFETRRTFDDDQPTGTGQDGYTVTVTLTDDDGGQAAATSPQVTVSNLDPVIESVTVEDAALEEGQTAVVSGTFSDAALGAVSETFTATAVWSDGVGGQVFVDAAAGTFTTSRTFTDDLPDALTVEITLSDDDGGQATVVTRELTVANVAPTLTLEGADTVVAGAVYTLTLGPVTDPGSDTVTEYRVDWGDGTSQVFTDPGQVSHVYGEAGSRTVTVTLVDEDGVFAAGSRQVEVTPAAQPEWRTEGDPGLTVSVSPDRFDLRSRTFASRITLGNQGDQDLAGPLRVVIESANKTVLGADGFTDDGQAFFLVDDVDQLLSVGEELTLDLAFSGGRGRVDYTFRVERLVTPPPVAPGGVGVEDNGVQLFDADSGEFRNSEDAGDEDWLFLEDGQEDEEGGRVMGPPRGRVDVTYLGL